MSVQRRAGTSLFAHLELHRGTLTVHPVGPSLALRESQVIVNIIRQRLQGPEPVARVILELDDVRYVNSAGISAFLQVQSEASRHGAALELRAVRPEIHRVLRMVGLDRVLVRAHRRHRRPTGRRGQAGLS